MRDISLSRVLSAVLVVVASFAASAQNDPRLTQRNDIETGRELCESMHKAGTKEREACYKQIFDSKFGGGNRCNESEKELNSATSKLVTSCQKAGGIMNSMKMDANSTGSACRDNILRCQQCAGSEDENNSASVSCSGFNYRSSSNVYNSLQTLNRGMQNLGQRNTDLDFDVEDEALSCLPRDAEELTSLRDEVKKAKEASRRSQDDVIRAQEDLNDVSRKNQEQQVALSDKAENIQSKVKQRITNIKRDLKNAEQLIQQKVDALQQNWDEAERAANQIQVKMVEANVAFNDAVRTLEGQCHAAALKQVEDLRQTAIKKMEAGAYSSKDFAGTLRQAGTSFSVKARENALKFYNACVEDSTFAKAKDSAGERLQILRIGATKELESIRKKQQAMEVQANQLKTEAIQSARQLAVEDMTEESELLTKDLDRLDREKANAYTNGNLKEQMARQKLDKAGLYASEDRTELDEAINRERTIRQHSAGVKAGKEGSTDEAIGAFSDLVHKSEYYVEACCTTDAKSGPCRSACSNLSQWGMGKGGKAKCKPYDDENEAVKSGRSAG